MNRTEVLEKLEPICRTSARPVEHSARTRVVMEPGQVLIRPGNGGHLVPVTDKGVKALTKFVGVPQKVAEELSPDLFGRVATELLARKERYNLLLENDEVDDFVPYRGVKNLPVERVLTTIERAIPGCDFHRVSILDHSVASLEIVGTEQQAVRRGDLVRAGAMVQFSPINTVMPLIQSYVLRLVCTNGATGKTVLSSFTGGGGGEGDDIWQWFRQSVEAAYRSLGAIVSRYQQMLQERIPPDQRATMLEALLKEAGISGRAAEAVRARALEEPPRNTYEMVNLITWASSHIIESPRDRHRALAASACFTSEGQHASICPLCQTRR